MNVVFSVPRRAAGAAAILFLSLLFVTAANADDWPQWLGPERDSVWRESGILTAFPEGGPKVAWRAPVGHGYGGPAVADGKVYVMDYEIESGGIENNPGGRTKLEGKVTRSRRYRWPPAQAMQESVLHVLLTMIDDRVCGGAQIG
ncbi:MAG: PQQ-binding-like beta-propeller repeat protein [Planctomycetes bacterium]|nr:PQQ-binding-like beta-propeller repeat protein [Planctomycetota bacterium]